MTANVLEHRRAKSFAEALEAHQAENGSTGSHRAGSTAMAELFAIADSLGALPEPELSPEVRTVQRAQLMAAFEQEWAGGGAAAAVPKQRGHRAARARRTRWGRRLVIGGLVGAVAVGSFAGAAAAAGNALPGDALYGMKRGLEGLRLDWADSDAERGALLLQQASTRLDEAQSLLNRDGSPTALSPGTVEQVRRALDDMHAEALRGRDLLRSVYRSNGSLAPMQKLASFAGGQDSRWTAMQSRLPSGLATQAGKVDRLFEDISEDVAPLRLEQPTGTTGGSGGGTGGAQQSPGTTGGAGTTAGTGTQRGGPGSAPTAHGTGTTSGTGTAPSTAPGLGSVLNPLTGPLTGGGATPSPSAGAQDAGSSPSGAASPEPQQGLSIPPLIPGLLPGLTLG
ncbi:DUF5667 domain-containing protein [Kitasatospora terrestris]|uniref:DUF5667 domain-containing protein n=1 Tax=Kitasatospora terrestris TaxID=258051 RepID=A0ABP9DU20_9ACTN